MVSGGRCSAVRCQEEGALPVRCQEEGALPRLPGKVKVNTMLQTVAPPTVHLHDVIL